MSIGSGIALIVIGAIMAFALHLPITWIDLNVVGYIVMGAGFVVFAIGMVALVRRRRSTSTDELSGREDLR